VGYMIGEVLGIDVAHGANNKPEDIARIKQSLKHGSKMGCSVSRSAATKSRGHAASSCQGRGPIPASMPKTTISDRRWGRGGERWRTVVPCRPTTRPHFPTSPPPFRGGEVVGRGLGPGVSRW
jgi:hypothetical protein